jgi:hypothetical protein
MHNVNWIGGIVFGTIFLVLAVSNGLAVASYVRHRRHVSAIPVFGGLAGLGACFLLPVEGLRSFWWLPLIVDYGSAPMIVTFFVSRIAASVRGDHAS